MRNLFIAFIVFSATTSLCGKTETNPFAKHGLKKVMMSTSSKGEFEEFHYNKEVVEIGSILYNTKTKEVIGYIDESIENDVTSATPAMSIDPNCEKYYWISPYAYCLNNPVRFIDPDGRDVWEIDELGKIINRISDKTQDAFYLMSKNENGKYQRTDNSISFKYGTITSVQEKNLKTDVGEVTLTMFNIKGDEQAKQLFEFVANPGKIEWSHNKIGTKNSQKNVVGTIHMPNNTVQGSYLSTFGYTIREDNHSHPRGTGPSPADLTVAGKILKKDNSTLFNIYNPKTKNYIPYNANGIISK